MLNIEELKQEIKKRDDGGIQRPIEFQHKYDIIFKVSSILELQDNGWPIEINTSNKNLEKIIKTQSEGETVIVGLAGKEKAGKTWVLN